MILNNATTFLLKAILDASNADSKKRRPFDGLVIDWNLIHIFAIVASIIMIFVNIYATWVVNNFRKVSLKNSKSAKFPISTFSRSCTKAPARAKTLRRSQGFERRCLNKSDRSKSQLSNSYKKYAFRIVKCTLKTLNIPSQKQSIF